MVTFNFHQLDKLSYDEAEPLLEEYFDDLVTQFLNSAMGQAYLQQNPEAGNWAYHFVEMGYLYEEVPPPKITRVVAQTIMEYTLPRKLILGDRSQAETAIPELVAFWTFVQQTYKHRNASAIIHYLQSIEQQFPDWMIDPSRGGMGKGFMLSALSQGYDITSEEGLQAFQAAQNQAIADHASSDPLEQLRSRLNRPDMDLPQSMEELRSRITPEIAAAMQELFAEIGAPALSNNTDTDAVNFFIQMMGSMLGMPDANFPLDLLGAQLGLEPDDEDFDSEDFDADDGGFLGWNRDPRAIRRSMLESKLGENPLTLTPELEKCLRSQSITATQPGPIVQDIQTCLDFIGPQGCKVSNKRQHWGGQTLRDLNDRLSRPIAVNFQRPQQSSYPNLHGLYLLLRCLGLVQVVPVGQQYQMQLHPENIAQWNQLNDTERYFTLLAAWLLYSSTEPLGETHEFIPPGERWVHSWLHQLIHANALKYSSYQEQNEFIVWPGMMNFALADLFGIVTVTQGKPQPKKGWRVKRVERSPWGTALMTLILQHYLDLFDGVANPSDTIAFDHLQPLISPYQALWRQGFRWQQNTKTVSDRHIFKVWLGSVWRRIVIDADATLYDLSELILASVNFDNDHLHQFTYRDSLGRTVEVGHPFLDQDELSSNQVEIGSLGLQVGSEIEYLFDFGDCWEFRIRLEGFAPAATAGQGFASDAAGDRQAKGGKRSGVKARATKAQSKKRSPVRHPGGEILERHGEAPPQYPD